MFLEPTRQYNQNHRVIINKPLKMGGRRTAEMAQKLKTLASL